jgi:hypothetical protein
LYFFHSWKNEVARAWLARNTADLTPEVILFGHTLHRGRSLLYRGPTAAKFKSRISPRVNEHCRTPKTYLLAKGIFATTAGKSTSCEIPSDLQSQSEHHGYDQRSR